MIRLRTLGLALVAVFALSAMAAASASAAEFIPASNTFKGKAAASPEPTLITEGKTITGEERKVHCTGSLETGGAITGAKSATSEPITFTGCKGPAGSTCTTSGLSAGQIKTVSLAGTLEEPSTGVAWLRLKPASGTEFATFLCEGTLIKETLKTEGSVAGVLTPTNTSTTSFELKFKHSATKPWEQEPASAGGLLTTGSGTESFSKLTSSEEATADLTTATAEEVKVL